MEEFFRLDAAAMEQAAAKRRPHNRPGWAVQWGTVRMLGTFLSAPADVPPGVATFVAEQLGIDDASCLKLYPERLPTQHEHAREIRKLLRIRDFDDGDLQLREHIAGRAWVSNDGLRALFDRAVTWLLRNRVLLPGLTPLGYQVAEVRKGEQALIYSAADAPVEPEFRRELLEILDVPENAFRSALERWRKGPRDVSGQGQKEALERTRDIRGVKAGEVDLWRVPPVKLARYGMNAHAPTLRRLAEPRRTATVLATMRHLEGASVDDALILFRRADGDEAARPRGTRGRQGEDEGAAETAQRRGEGEERGRPVPGCPHRAPGRRRGGVGCGAAERGRGHGLGVGDRRADRHPRGARAGGRGARQVAARGQR